MSITIKDLNKVYRTTFEARNEWQNILLELGVSCATIDSIEAARKGNSVHCYRDGLKGWLEGQERSWGDLVKALSSPTVGHEGIARRIEQLYIQSDGQTSKNVVHMYLHARLYRYSI